MLDDMRIKAILSIAALTLIVLLCSRVAFAGASYRDLLQQAEVMASAGDSDSAASLFHQALQSAETEYHRSDSTIDIVFYPDGIRTPVYFASYTSAGQTYTDLLSSAEKIFGPEHAEVSNILLKLAEVQRVLGKYYDAEPLARRALAIREAFYGAYSIQSAPALHQLGLIIYYSGRWYEAANTCDSALSMVDSLLDHNHPQLARICLDLALILTEIDYFDEAYDLSVRASEILLNRFGEESLEAADCYELTGLAKYFLNRENDRAEAAVMFERCLNIRKKNLGPNHPSVATAYLRLANACRYLDRLSESDTLLAAALRIRETEFGRSHPETGEIYYFQGLFHQFGVKDFRRAKSAYSLALEIRESTLDSLHPFVIRTAFRLGHVCFVLDDYLQAVQLLKPRMDMLLATGSGETPLYLDGLRWLAGSYEELGRLSEAMPLLQQSVILAAKIYGDTSTRSAEAIEDLGFLHFRLGSFDKAESEFERARQIYVLVHGRAHPDIADVMGRLALAYQSQGRLTESAETYRRALDMFEEFPEKKGSDGYCALKLNLSLVNIHAGQFDEAERGLEESIEILEALYGPRYSNVAIGLLNLGLVYEAQNRYSEADSVLRLSIDIGEEALGPQSPGLAHALNNLANLYVRLGRYDEARPIQERAVSILETALGPQHPEVAKFRRDLGRLYACTGYKVKSLESYKMFIDWSQRYLENVFPYSSEQQKLVWISKYPIIDPTVFSLAIQDGTPASKELALEMLLKSKAMVIEAVMAEKQAAYCHYDDEILAELDRLNEINGLIASLSMVGGYYIDSVATLYILKDSIEVALSRHCSEFSDALAARRFEVKDVYASIPRGSVLWEFVRYIPTDLNPNVLGDAKLGPPRYLAFTVDRTGQVNLKDLGDAHHIDSLITVVREMIYRAQPQIYSVAAKIAEERLNEVTGQLYALLFAPLVGNNGDICISPDGMLNLLPFEILPAPDGSYAIEKYRISYLSSGRDLLKLNSFTDSEGEIVVMADPDFDGTATRTIISDELFGPEMRGNTDCLNQSFNPLPYSRTEALSVAACFRDGKVANVRECYGTMASEESLKNMPLAPKVVHLATHGFFCESADTSIELLNNPLLRSGLVLTGANRTISGIRNDSTSSEDGILTALEVSGLNLVGTDLAVLSACESGVGEFVNGEGLFGLRRAFQHAGAETIVMSLWSVPDKETSQLMDGFYRRWLGGSSKRDALRESALEVLGQSRSKRGCGHPLLWGGFILAGNPN